MQNRKPFLLNLYALWAVIESAAAFYSLASIPSDAENALFGGYSFSRLVLLGAAAIPFFAFGRMLFALRASSTPLVLWVGQIFESKSKRIFVGIVSSLLIFFSLLFWLMPPVGFQNFAAFAKRLAPLVSLGGLLGAQTLLIQFFWREQKNYLQNLHQWKSIFAVAALFFAFALAVLAWVFWSGIGLKPETYGWNSPGTPILFSQLLAALLLSLLFMLFKNRIELWYLNIGQGKKYWLKFETLIFLALWLAAFWVWQAEPMRKYSYFTPAPTAPNFQSYPYSDAGFYDTTSQSILIGEGRSLTVILRPLYIFFLTLLHLIGGQDYALILTLQTLSLAMMPALAFLLVSLLGGQSAGLLAAVLIIFREKNAIALTNIIEVSHSKLLLSDLPTMALILLMVYALLNWLKSTKANALAGLAAGVSFGLVALVRSQAQLLLPIVLLAFVFSGGFAWRKALQRTLIFALGFFMVVTPWVWRNFQVSGAPAIENTGFYLPMLAGGYAEPTDVVNILPGETQDEYGARVKSQIVRYVFNHPLEIAQVYASYFIHNEIISVIYLPMSFQLYDLYAYVKVLPFWQDPYINLQNGYGLIFLLNLGFIALGLAVAFARLKFLGLLPLLIHFAYSLSVVVARISGWRFVLPVDWALQVYYSIGVMQLALMLISIFWNKKIEIDPAPQTQTSHTLFRQTQPYLVAAAFLALGLFMPMLEQVFSVRYPNLPPAQLLEAHASAGLGHQVTLAALENFLHTEPAATVLYGRALYPSYYEKGNFWGESSPNLLAASQFNRLQFTLIGPVQTFTFIPLQSAPQSFPHAADVLVVGCRQGSFLRALLIKIDDQILTSSPWGGLTCSTLE